MLRRRDAGESDRRLTVLSRERGKLDVVAKGARKGGSRLAGSSEPLAAVEFQVAVGKVNRFVTQAQPSTSFPGLRADFDRLAMGLALLELFEAVLPWEEADPEGYELLLRSLQALERHPKPAVALAWAEVALLVYTGFQPSFVVCASNGSALASGTPWYSPLAGGLVSDGDAHGFQDAFRTRAEALMGLERTAELNAPPPNLKFVEECLRVLLATWRHVLERPLPAATQAYEAVL